MSKPIQRINIDLEEVEKVALDEGCEIIKSMIPGINYGWDGKRAAIITATGAIEIPYESINTFCRELNMVLKPRAGEYIKSLPMEIKEKIAKERNMNYGQLQQEATLLMEG